MPSNENGATPDTTDVSDTKEAIRNFAHEIQTPLNAMLGYAQLIESELKPGCNLAVISDYNDTVKIATTRLLQICERVLNETVSSESIVKKQKVNAAALASEIVATFKALAKDKGIQLICEFPSDFPTLMTDPVLLGQVLSNLISNAVKFTPRGGIVKVKGELSAQNDALIFVIQDTGEGIPADLLIRMRRGEFVSTAHHHGQKGWGRGLKIVSDICEKLDADLSFEDAKNGGTVALVSLPVLE